ncbi:TPA: hypothetical protein NIG45_006031 [Pseudomonas aeruginosa]|nr:hypothetical protein [Pseudomonas aeruginosa]
MEAMQMTGKADFNPHGNGENVVSFRRDGKGGNGTGGDGMDTRIINLERDMTDVKVAIGKVETRLETIQSTMVTKGQLAVYALLGLIAVGGGGWWIVQQYLAPILAAIGKLPS